MSTNIQIGEADFDLVRNKMIEFLKRDGSPFQEYNFNSSGLSGLLDLCSYTASYLAAYMNMGISELFLHTAILEDSIYKLIHNFNYIPKLKTPAKAYLKTSYRRNNIDDDALTVGAAEAATFKVDEEITGDTSGATGVVDVIDTINDVLYIKEVVGTFIVESITSENGATGAVSLVTNDNDYYSADDDDKFDMYFNYLNYTTDYRAIPTFRDKYVEDQYTILNVATDDVTRENKAKFVIEPYIDTVNNVRYLQTIVPLYQAEWQIISNTIVASNFNDIIYLSEDGTVDGTMFGDKVVDDTIRVYVYENAALEWFEYKNLRKGLFDHENKRAFQMKYDPGIGLYIKFNIDGYSRALLDDDEVRVVFVTTEGETINEIDGVNLFSNTENNLNDIDYLKIENSTDSADVLELDSSTGSVVINVGDKKRIEMQIIESSNVDASNAFLINGLAKQSVDDIRESAPLFYTTQGRAVTESDYNSILKKRYSEYFDVRAWGGNMEFIDMTQIVTNVVEGESFSNPPTTEEIVGAVQLSMGTMYNPSVYENEFIAIESVTNEKLTNGEFIRDKGYVYFTISDNNFKFETNNDAINEITAYLDEYKILSIYFKYMYPTYAILNPVISIKLNSAYTKTFTIRDIKQKVYDYINEQTKKANKFYASALYSQINQYDEVEYVDDISFTIDIKCKAQSDTSYTRLYLPIAVPLSTTINGKVFATTAADIEGIGDVEYDSVVIGKINYNTGFLRYTYDFIADGIDEYYITDVVVNSNYVFSARDCYYGVEYMSNITISAI